MLRDRHVDATSVHEAVAEGRSDEEPLDLAESSAPVSARATRTLGARKALVDRLALVARTAQVLPDADAEFKAHFELPAVPNDPLLLTSGPGHPPGRPAPYPAFRL